MNEDKIKMENLQKNQHGNVTLGTNVLEKLPGQGKARINKTRVTSNSLLVQQLKKNILSVGQIANKGNIIVFSSTTFKVMNELSGKFIIRGYKNRKKLYVFEDWNFHNMRMVQN